MTSRFLNVLFAGACLVAVTGLSAFAQNRPPGGGAGGPGAGGFHQGPAGNPSGPGGPNGPGGGGAMSSGAGGSQPAAHNGFQLGPVGRWWDNKSVVQAIGLRADQKQQIDAIFNANKPAILSSYKTFLREQSKLNALNKDPHVDRTRLFAAIDAVNQARASLQKVTSQMYLQIRAKMDSQQIEKLEKLN